MNSREEIPTCGKDGVLLPGDVVWVKLPRDFWWPGVVITKDVVNSRGKKYDKLKNVVVRLYGRNKCIKVSEEQWWIDFQDFQKNNSNYSEMLMNSMKQHVISKVSGKSKTKKEHKGEDGEANALKESKSEDKKGKKSKDDPEIKKEKYSELKSESKDKSAEAKKESKDESTEVKKESKDESTEGKKESKDETVKKKKKVKIDELLKQENDRKSKKQKVVEDEPKDVNVSRRVKIMRHLGLCPPIGSPFSFVL